MIGHRILTFWAMIVLLPVLISCASSELEGNAESGFTLLEATIGEIQAAYDAGELTSVELVRYYLDRIVRYDRSGPEIRSIISVHPGALEQAAALDRERARHGPRGPLHGIPVLLKDNIDTFDLPTTNGSAVLEGVIPPDDATLVTELRAAGAIILGKAAMGEFAAGGYNSVLGETLNPYNFKRDTGGSSSGPGAAIAANFAVLAVGTDTSTSVRGPAAYTGIVGLRPTTGLISRDGIAPKNLEFDTAGPMARTVTDVAHMLGVMAVRDATDPVSVAVWNEVSARYEVIDGHIDYSRYLDRNALAGKRVGVLRDFFGGDPEIDAMTEEALALIEALGATLVDIRLDQDFLARYTGKGQSEIRRIADYRFREDWEEYLATLPGAPRTVAEFIEMYETVINGSALPATDYTMELLRDSMITSTSDPIYEDLVNRILPKATADKLALFDEYGVDVLVFPYASSFARVISNPVEELEDPTYVRSDAPSPATLAGYSSTGFPSIVVPMGIGSAGLPMDLGFLGRPYSDGPLLGYAYAYEQISRKRLPPPLLP